MYLKKYPKKLGNLNEEDAIHYYLALLTAVEAITE
jgi:hypothetical protein